MTLACLSTDPRGILLQVKALAAARKNELRGIENGRLKVATTAVAEKGKANEAITRFLVECLQLSSRNVELLRGSTSNQKTFLIQGVELNEISARLARHLPPG